MGVKNISKLLKNYGKIIETQEIFGKTISIDTSIYLYRFKYNTENNDFIKKFIYQLVFFKKNNITPVYVFDSGNVKEKKVTIDKRREEKEKKQKLCDEETDLKLKQDMKNKIITITKKDTENLKKLFDICCISYINSNTEAEKYCAFLNKTKKVDYVMSNDYDSLAFGCEKLITLDKKSNYVMYCLNDILEDKQITIEQFVDLCICSGTDYYPEGIRNIGPVKALNNIKKYGEIEKWKKNKNTNMDIPEDLQAILQDIRDLFLSEPEIIEDSLNTNCSVEENLDDFVKELGIIINPSTISYLSKKSI